MEKTLFEELLTSVQQMNEIAEGKREPSRVTVLEPQSEKGRASIDDEPQPPPGLPG